MNLSRIALVFFMLFGLCIHTEAAESEYKAESKVLTIPIVKIGNSFIYDVTLQLNDFDIIAYSRTPSSDKSVNAECSEEKITLEAFNQIANGMTLEQVSGIIGCKGSLNLVSGDRSLYNWVGVESAVVPKISLQFENNVVVYKSYAPSK